MMPKTEIVKQFKHLILRYEGLTEVKIVGSKAENCFITTNFTELFDSKNVCALTVKGKQTF